MFRRFREYANDVRSLMTTDVEEPASYDAEPALAVPTFDEATALLSTVIIIDRDGVRMGLGGFGGEDGPDPRLNMTMPMGLTTSRPKETADGPG